MRDAQVLVQFPHEITGSSSRDLLVEGMGDDEVYPGLAQELGTFIWGGQVEGLGAAAQHCSRVRVEGKYYCRSPYLVGSGSKLLDEILVTAVDAIK